MIQNFIKGQEAWDKLQNLEFAGENSYSKFFKDWDIFYRPYYLSIPDRQGKVGDLIQVSFHWIINRDYSPKDYDHVENPPYWEICIGMPPNPDVKGAFKNYSAPRFIWNNERGLKEIFLAPKVNYDI